MSKLHNPILSVSVFLATVATFYFAHDRVVGMYMMHTVENEAQRLLLEVEDKMLASMRLLDKLGTLLNFDCAGQDRQTLRLHTYESPHVRALQLRLVDGRHCISSNNGMGQEEVVNWQPLQWDFLIGSSLKKLTNSHKLVLVKSRPDYTLVADLEPIEIPHTFCEGCAWLQVELGNTRVLMSKSDHSKVESSLTAVVQGKQLPLQIQLSVSTDYLSTIHHNSRGLSLLLGILVGILFVALLQWSTRRGRSLHALIDAGIRNREFLPWYQPIIDSKTGDVVGCEVLMRWYRNDGTIIPPQQFIPYVEQSGQIIPMTDQLLSTVARDVRRLKWHSGKRYMSLNIVPEHLNNDRFAKTVISLLSAKHMSPGTLSLEITERNKIPNLQTARRYLELLYAQGIPLKIDDAGTGYGGFSYVQELGVAALKIDKMFIDTIGTDDYKRPILDAIVAFARTSRLTVIAEGVETREQVEYLAKQGVHLIQGFFYAKPMPIQELMTWLARKKPDNNNGPGLPSDSSVAYPVNNGL